MFIHVVTVKKQIQVMIMYSKVTKGTSEPTETTTGNRNVNNIITLILNTHGTV